MSESNGEKHFDDQEPVEVQFTVGKRRFILREADTAVYTKYRDGMHKEITVDPDSKKISAGCPTRAQIQAVAMSVVEIVTLGGKDKSRKLTVDEVMKLKPAVTKWAFEKLLEISPGMSVDSDDKARRRREESLKNLPDGGTPPSDTATSLESSSTT